MTDASLTLPGVSLLLAMAAAGVVVWDSVHARPLGVLRDE